MDLEKGFESLSRKVSKEDFPGIYQELQEKNLLLRKQYHDIAGHLQVISILLQKGNLDKVEKYIQHFL